MKYFHLASLIAFGAILLLGASCKPKTPAAIAGTLPDTTGYYAARDLKGLGYFILGESTFKETVKKIKAEMREDSRYNYDPDPFWSEDLRYSDLKVFSKDTTIFYKDGFYSDKVLACPYSERIELFKYYVGGLELGFLTLDFFNDTLIVIQTADYGSNLGAALGRRYGTEITTHSTERIEQEGKYKYQVSYIRRIWHNERVIASYERNSKYLLIKGEIHLDGRSYSNDSPLVIELKSDNRREDARKCENEYLSLYKSRKQALANEKLKEL